MANTLNMYDMNHNGRSDEQSRSAPVDPRPLRWLTLRTPRLELRSDDDDGVFELAEEAKLGVHSPEEMPFTMPWTDAAPDDVAGHVVRHFWRARADHRTDDWHVNFLIRLDGRVIGTLKLEARDFSITRQIRTGSWIGRRHQGKGYGREARTAVLLFAFDRIGARSAMSAAFADNVRSLGVSRALGYVGNGGRALARRGVSAEQIELILTTDRFEIYRPPWNIEVTGLDIARKALGL